ncbi:hypothetical protein ACFSR7_16985 [Cohnella sp. GCM10020058]|uniref:hypothetical protein n=1 Tax=Cohnella sp. GCM10020058 TaxID=3317330 RepID=UPI003637F791
MKLTRKATSRLLAGLCLLLSLMPSAIVFPHPASATAVHTVTINPNTVVQSDYKGVGVNIIPSALMAKSREQGYTTAHWEMDKERILAMKPKVARVWFQIDWMESAKGSYSWDNLKMQAFYQYLDVLKSAGTEVELNFGWKNGSTIHSWFPIAGSTTPYESAPADLDAFAASASAALQQLISVRGYTNIKYMTFYNEPNGSWDFEAPGDQKLYYANMVKKVHDRLVADGRRSLVKLWGPEETGAPDWTQYMKTNIDSYLDGYSFHVYGEPYATLSTAISARTSVVGAKPVYLTEFGWASDNDSGWDSGYANTVIKSANEGVNGAQVWQLNGGYSTDPDGSTNGNYDLYDALYTGLTPKKAFYAAGLLARYIPAHSSVVSVSTGSADVRAAAFKTSGGDYTIVLETKAGTDRNVTFNFSGVNVGKTFRKHFYQDTVALNANATIPKSVASFAAGTSFTDSAIDANYNVIVYTTLPAQTQVEVSPVNPAVTAGASVTLAASVVDNTGGVTWSVVSSGNGTISSGGVYTAPRVISSKLVAVKAASTADPASYGIALVRVNPDGSAQPANAGFESPATTGTVVGPTTAGWTFNSRAGIQRNGSVFGALDYAPEGLQTAYLKTDGGVAGEFSQSLTLAADTYTLSFKAAQRASYGGAQSFNVLFDGTIVGSFTPSASGAFAPYTTGTFAASAGSHTIKFAAMTTAGDNTAFIDEVMLSPATVVPVTGAGFETPSVAAASTKTAWGPATYGGWTFNSRAGLQYNGSVLGPSAVAPEGVQTAYLKTDGGVPGEFSQSVTFPSAGTYKVTFKAAQRTSFGGVQSFNVLYDGAVIGSFTTTSGAYVSFATVNFAATAGSHAIKFLATTTTGDNTAFIDDVAITAA